MDKLWLIIKREYLVRVRTKAFVLSTVGLPLFTIGMFMFQAYTATHEREQTINIDIVDETGKLGEGIATRMTAKLANGQPSYKVVKILERPSPDEVAAVRDQVEHGNLDAFLSVPADIFETKASAELHARNTADAAMHANDSVDDAVSGAVIAARLAQRGMAAPDLSQIVKAVDVKLIKVSAQGDAEEKGQTFFAALGVAMVLYITVLVYGVSTMRSVIEEKSTRVVELLAASVRPVYLLTGKILGVAGVGVTQYLIWLIAGSAIAGYGMAAARQLSPGAQAPSIHLPPGIGYYMVIFFLCGYFLYASLYAAVGAMVSNEQEMQQVQMPVTLLIVSGFVLFNIILRDPNSTASIVLSMIPFFSPILMVLRIAMQPPPIWQIALSVAISLGTTCGIVWVAARIYRVGVLMYGKRPSLVEVARWLKYS